ncbi:copper chaperone PCu(A)C [Roseomonas sp. OT10]|uniref:copper chaperone PCu(A)C n=1 Tax=Roseomonas cutis TaxID=2897332 RepID=UPI001E54FB55|nr:copper chaperone PCu(A)C [Roseomonas sp. OT10]UFN50382.1 copper chaperone PCu(A)C [Roseomonas sp. OT10]
MTISFRHAPVAPSPRSPLASHLRAPLASHLRAPLARRPVLALLAALTLPAPLLAHSYKAGEVSIGHPWSRPAAQGGTGAGYLTLRNGGSEADRLVGASSPAAREVQIHVTREENGVMRMRPVEAVDLPPGQEVALAPGGLHLMLLAIDRPFRVGDRVPLTLRFARAGEVTVELSVDAPRGGSEPAHRH